jgi:hypothetical protein
MKFKYEFKNDRERMKIWKVIFGFIVFKLLPKISLPPPQLLFCHIYVIVLLSKPCEKIFCFCKYKSTLKCIDKWSNKIQ